MAMFVQTITAAQVLAGLTTDTTKWAGANIANLDQAISTTDTNLTTDIKKTIYLDTTTTWDENADGSLTYRINQYPFFNGTYYMKTECTSTGSSGDNVQFKPLAEDANNYIIMSVRGDNGQDSPRVIKKQAAANTTLLTSGVTTDTSEHEHKFTRDGMGNFELFLDGVSKGTCNEEFTPVGNYAEIALVSSAGNSVFDIKEIWAEMIKE